MKKIHKLNSKLNKAGIATLRVIEAVDELVDDTIEVTDRVHIQSGNGYLVIYSKIDEESYNVFHADGHNLIQKLQSVLQSHGGAK